MTSKDEYLLADALAIIEEFGEAITYTVAGDPDAEPKSINAVIDQQEQEALTFYDDGTAKKKRIQVQITDEEVNGIVSPVKGDKVSWNGQTWTVIGLPDNDRWHLQSLVCEQVISSTKGPGYYKQR
jgi:hypothetical protein